MSELSRRLGTVDAVVIGLGSMMGAGVFAAFGPAARAAGAGLLIGLAIAAAIAYCNATASAQLAAVYPTSGGTYIYGRERLGPWWGFIAGWGFVIGKTASCAAMVSRIFGTTILLRIRCLSFDQLRGSSIGTGVKPCCLQDARNRRPTSTEEAMNTESAFLPLSVRHWDV